MLNSIGNTGINALFQAVFLECLYQKKFSKVMTRQETIDCLTGPRFEGSFLALLGIPAIYTVICRDRNKILVQINKKQYFCESYACFAIVEEGQERDKNHKSGRIDIYTWDDTTKKWDFDSPISGYDFEVLKIVLFDEYEIRLD